MEWRLDFREYESVWIFENKNTAINYKAIYALVHKRDVIIVHDFLQES